MVKIVDSDMEWLANEAGIAIQALEGIQDATGCRIAHLAAYVPDRSTPLVNVAAKCQQMREAAELLAGVGKIPAILTRAADHYEDLLTRFGVLFGKTVEDLERSLDDKDEVG